MMHRRAQPAWGRAALMGPLVCGLWTGCESVPAAPDVALFELAIEQVGPEQWVPGTTVVVRGRAFVDAPWGRSTLQLRGEDGLGGSFAVELPLRYESEDTLVATLDGGDFDVMPRGRFTGTATLVVDSAVDGRAYPTAPLPWSWEVADTLSPALHELASGTVVYVNDDLVFESGGILLGGAEGTTVALWSGCLRAGTGACEPTPTHEVEVKPLARARRDGAVVRLPPEVVGMSGGTWHGELLLANRSASGQEALGPVTPLTLAVKPTAITQISPGKASLGQYVDIGGGGFLGGAPGQFTEVQLIGTYQPADSIEGFPVVLTVIPEFRHGRLVRYALNENDQLGTSVDLRTARGTFSGQAKPRVTWGAHSVVGPAFDFSLTLQPVRQVVFLDFRDSFREALRRFGLRALEPRIRQRIVEVLTSTYAGVGLEVRTSPPDDMALFSHVELGGPDPNGRGLLGYDNSHGKDRGNQRLYDRLGGANALTQQDGEAGFGGVFLESLMAYSKHPTYGEVSPLASEVFDAIFDPLRPDRGEPAGPEDVVGYAAVASGAACPGATRAEQVACGVWVVANVVGETLAHELGHSLGLASPDSDLLHYENDVAGRLMDKGGHRPFLERAQLQGQGPNRLCIEEYSYLRAILPTTAPPTTAPLPPCH